MNNLRKTIPVIIILLAGCTTLSLRMKVDPSLETHARVYEVKSPNSWSVDKKLNVSFGAYRVEDANTGRRKTKTSSANETSLANQLLGMSSSDATNIKGSHSLAYAFIIGNEITWDSQCVHLAEKRVTKNKNVSSLEILSSRYACRYTRADNEPWVLSIEQHDLAQIDIRMTNGEKLFRAHATAGMYVTSDGRPYKTFRPGDAGYTWTHDDNNVAAISVEERPPRVWLDKRNPDSMNHVLSMASTGLLIYHLKILPKLKQH